jgi:hypothetical protein
MLHDTGFKVVEVTGHPASPGPSSARSRWIIVLASAPISGGWISRQRSARPSPRSEERLSG